MSTAEEFSGRVAWTAEGFSSHMAAWRHVTSPGMAHLLQQHRVVALKRLKDIMIAA